MPEIAIIDLWTDSNRGDNALQVSLVRLLRQHYPGATVRGVFRFGTNEIDAARAEIVSTASELDEAVGGIRRTDYSEVNAGRSSLKRRRLVSLLSFVEAFLCTVCFLTLRGASRRVIGADRHRSLSIVRDADVVVWKGKNFRDYEGLASITRTLTLGGAGFFASLLRSRVDCINASFWPIERWSQRFLYRRAFRGCRSITVRDPSSVANAHSLFGARIPVRYCADLSFGLLARSDPPISLLRGEATWDVALTITAWGSEADQARYLDGLVAAVDRLSDRGATRFVVVPQVTRAAEDASALTAALCERVRRGGRGEVEVIDGSPSITGLLHLYARCRMLIGSRMHSCVFARAVRVPFVAISYDVGPKWEVLSSFWEPHLILTYDAGPEVLAAACETVWTQGAALIEASEGRWRACVEGSADNVALLDA